VILGAIVVMEDKDNLERRIGRQLDGAMDEAEAAGLQRELLRDPAARRLMDATAAADRLAGDALRAAFAPEASFADARDAGAREAWEANLRSPARPAPARWAVAAAAGLLLAAGAWALLHWLPGRHDKGTAGIGALPAPIHAVASRPDDALPAGLEQLFWDIWEPPQSSRGALHPAAAPSRGDQPVPPGGVQGPRTRRRMIDRQILGVYDEQEKAVYLLGVDHVRTCVDATESDL